MIPKEAVKRAFLHKEAPVIPYNFNFTQRSLERMITYTGNPHIESVLKKNTCMNYIQYQGRPCELPQRPGFFQDEFEVIWNRSGVDKDIGVIDSFCIEDLESHNYKLPPLREDKLRQEYDTLTSQNKDKFVMAGFGIFFFERAWSIMGMENLLANMILSPKELDIFFGNLCEYYMAMIDIALEYDIDGIYFGDDWGQQRGLIMGPEHWRGFIKPHIRKLYDHIKSADKFIVQHSCGDCLSIFPDLIDMGLDCYQTFQPEIYDISYVKTTYGNDLAFWGGISTQKCLPIMSPEQVKEVTISTLRTMKPGGGYIASPTHALPYDVPPENILAMIDVFENQDKYL